MIDTDDFAQQLGGAVISAIQDPLTVNRPRSMPPGSSVVASMAEHRHYHQDHRRCYQAIGKQLDHATHLRLVGPGSLRHPSSASNKNHSAKSRWISRASSDWHFFARCECSAAFALYSARFDTTHPLCSGSGPGEPVS
jgi:hypothetical protein